MKDLETHVRNCGLEKTLLELVKTRVSQINGCAYCIDMHTKDARANGETEQRLYAPPAWRETPFFSTRERSALSWAEALTAISEKRIPESLIDETLSAFSEIELANLTFAVIAINGWNRLALSSGVHAGSYEVGKWN
ncbi:MAG TPA: carboxymuconolactone decarboxylase family protein [Burkholderiales bacterium]|nr:carboxymuconolactone decarboxylase family protein [Burkholderiales bacterium]